MMIILFTVPAVNFPFCIIIPEVYIFKYQPVPNVAVIELQCTYNSIVKRFMCYI